MAMKLTRWIVALALAAAMMALVLAGAARAQSASSMPNRDEALAGGSAHG